MLYLWRYLCLAAVLLGIHVSAFAQDAGIQIQNGESIANLIAERSSKIQSFRGTILYQVDSTRVYGSIIYSAPDMFVMNFKSSAFADKIGSDGKHLFILDGNTLIRESILPQPSSSIANAWNIKRLRRNYTPSKPEGGFYTTTGKGSKNNAYQLLFLPKSNTSGFRSITLICSLDGLVQRIEAVSAAGEHLKLSLWYKQFNQTYPVSTFQVETDENTFVYDNVLSE